ncbi:MAG: HAD family acid phosphatase [Planctomycetota bacterium]
MRIPRIMCAALLCALIGVAPMCPAGQVKLPNDIAWVASSDAYKACLQQAYNSAGMRLRELAKAEKPGTWCVVLDADETIISNIEFQKDLALKGTEHSSGSWDEWCNKGTATALPGAKEYCALVRELGGKVIVVTNREDPPTKAATVKNLADLGFTCDAVLFREGPYAKDRMKTARREDIEKGTVKTLPEGKSLPPLKIVMLGGDQIHDLYDAHKYSFEQVKDRFGRDLIILPNPMYGDWMKKGSYVEVPEAKAEAPVAKAGEPGKAGAAPAAPGAITPKAAAGKIGESVVVEGKVASVRTRERGPDSLYFEGEGKEGLSLALFDTGKSGDAKAKFEGKKIRVRGKVTEYRGAAQIKVSDPAQIEVIE